MAKKIGKSNGPSCACGKPDLYEEWIKSNEDNKDKVSDSANTTQADADSDSADDAVTGGSKGNKDKEVKQNLDSYSI